VRIRPLPHSVLYLAVVPLSRRRGSPSRIDRQRYTLAQLRKPTNTVVNRKDAQNVIPASILHRTMVDVFRRDHHEAGYGISDFCPSRGQHEHASKQTQIAVPERCEGAGGAYGSLAVLQHSAGHFFRAVADSEDYLKVPN